MAPSSNDGAPTAYRPCLQLDRPSWAGAKGPRFGEVRPVVAVDITDEKFRLAAGVAGGHRLVNVTPRGLGSCR